MSEKSWVPRVFLPTKYNADMSFRKLALVSAFLPGFLLLLGSGGSGHRLPTTQVREPAIPASGFDLKNLADLESLSTYVTLRTFRIEAVHRPSPPLDPSHPRIEDGAGVVVSPGMLLTTARYLVGADSIRVVGRDGKSLSASLVRLDSSRGLALVSFDSSGSPARLAPVGLASLPPPPPGAAASEVVVPLHLVGASFSVRIAAVMPDDGFAYISGILANGVPAFDRYGRLVALSDRPTPDRTRSVAILVGEAADWLRSREYGESDNSSVIQPAEAP